jgi:hypothetical protein
MQLIDTQIREEGGSNPAFRIEFSGDGGEVISVLMRQSGDINRDNVIAKARQMLIDIGNIEAADRPSA